MAGLIEIDKERSWSVTGWVFESVDFKLLEGARSTVPLIVSLEGCENRAIRVIICRFQTPHLIGNKGKLLK
jgi:hypothetical protein